VVNVGHGPTGELRTGMEQDFHEAQDSGVVDFYDRESSMAPV